jgi:hypothetical protein
MRGIMNKSEGNRKKRKVDLAELVFEMEMGDNMERSELADNAITFHGEEDGLQTSL